MNQVKSVLVTKFGGYESLLVKEHPLDEVKDDLIEVEVFYCGINFADLYTRQGLLSKEIPFVLGMECAGIVTAVGEIVKDRYKIGQRVICYDYNGGMFRTKVVLPSSKCYFIPDDVSLKDAAALFVNYLTAYFSITQLGHLQPSEHLFINSCAGGVGIAATQLAKLIDNVTVYGTTSVSKMTAAQANGADFLFDYTTYKDRLKELCPDGLDLIIDNQAGDSFLINQLLLKSFGRMVLIGANNIIQNENQLTESSLKDLTSEISISQLMINSTCISGLHLGIISEKHPDLMQNTLNKIFSLYREKKIYPIIDSVWELENIVEATKLLQERRNIGKVLLRVKYEN